MIKLPPILNGKVLLVANTAWYLHNFRLPLAKSLLSRGFEPVFVCPRGPYWELLKSEGFRCLPLKLSRSGTNMFREISSINHLRRIYREESPALVHHFTIKCVVYGSIAAKLEKVPRIVNSITGLGHVFLSTSWKKKCIKLGVQALYRRLFAGSNLRIIFQNSDDRGYFEKNRLLATQNYLEIPTSGVDTTYFAPIAKPSRTNRVVLFAARLLREKGVVDFIETVKILNKRQVKARFILGGAPDPGNPSSVSLSDLDDWRAIEQLEIPGHLTDMRAALGDADIFVLPSYREGGSKSILEASAMGLPVVTYNVPGCNNLVEDNKTGLVVPPKNSLELANAIERLLLDPVLRREMGRAGREKVTLEFSAEEIARRTIAAYDSLGLSASSSG